MDLTPILLSSHFLIYQIELNLSLKWMFFKGPKVEYGMPQCLTLGTILFNTYINDLPINIESVGFNGFLFADDLGLTVSNLSKCTIDNKLVSSITLLKKWCAAYNLSLNTEKYVTYLLTIIGMSYI